MRIKRYRAPDSRQAMKLVKAAHGEDAAVLDCYSVEDGVEIVVSWEEPAATPQELSAVEMLQARQQAIKAEAQRLEARHQPARPCHPQQAAQPAPAARQNPVAATATAAAVQQRHQPQVAATAARPAQPHVQAQAQAQAHAQADSPQMVWAQDEEILTMKRELAEMKNLLVGQLKGHSWKDADHQAPQQQQLNQFMSALDLEPKLGRELAKQIPASEPLGIQREMLKLLLTRSLPVVTPNTQGAIALVGPQGSGKTTSIAKLAAQHVLLHGKDSVAILSTDTARVGAQEQLRAYGSILQVPVHCADDPDEAVKLYRLLRSKSLLLVDTAGVSFRDRAGLDQLKQLVAAMPGLRVMLNLPADSQSHVQREIIEAYQPLGPEAAVVSRIDEATRLGGIISNLIQYQLPAAWYSNGPNVPRNLSAADGAKLIKMAVRMSSYFEEKQPEDPSGGQPPAAAPVPGSRLQAQG